MGHLFAGFCYSSAVDVTDAYFSGQGVSMTAGSPMYLGWYAKEADGWKVITQGIDSGGGVVFSASRAATVPAFADCDPVASLGDGFALGWAVVAAMALAWGIMQMRRGL